MKLSLRNLALASAVMVAGAAFAQDAPTITKVWGTSVAGPGKNDSRFGTGVNGKVYYNDKAAGKVMVIDAEGQKEYAAVEGLGTGITSDDAGNLMVNTSFPNTASATNMVLISTEGAQTPIVLSYPKEVEAARVDQIGRIVGDVFSEEGSFFYMGANNATSVAMFQLAEGKQITPLEYYASEALTAPTLNTSAVVQPEFTFEELVDMGDDAINGFAARNRSSKTIYYFNPEGEFVAMPAPAGANTQEGFDVFTLGDVMYQVQPIKGSSGNNYSCEFVIADEEGNIIFTEEIAGAEDAAQSFGSFAARKVSDYKVELYMYYSSGKGIQAAQYDITLPEPQVELPTFYLRGTLNEWGGISEQYLMVNNGEGANDNGEYVYTINVPVLSGEFKFATEDWSTFNYGAKGEDPVVENGKTLESWSGSSVNFNMQGLVLNDATITFYYQPDAAKPSYVKVDGTVPAVAKTTDRGQFVYNLSLAQAGNNVFTVTFESTGDAASATLVLTDKAPDESV
ncbi:MAG: hypothetical protein K2K84_04330, partial [Muribaculaceae bacterium]|nr:hypothetical protein [Muribaculaceae bacterium]